MYESKYTHADIKKTNTYMPKINLDEGLSRFKWYKDYEHSTDLKIAIVGHGFVVKATDAGFVKSVDKFIVAHI